MPDPEATAGDAKLLRIGLISEVQNLDPSRAQDFVSLMAVSQIFETPFAPPQGDEPARPVLFSEPLASESEDRTRYSAQVRPDVRFSDGTPLTPELLARSLARVSHIRDLASTEVSGDRLHFHLRRSNARFELVLAEPYSGVVLESGSALLGTGPYRLADDSTPQRLHLTRNPHHQPPPAIGELRFTCYPPDEEGRPTALLAALEEGRVDFTNVLNREDTSELRRVRKAFAPGNSTSILYFNTERPELASSEVRRALATAIDRVEVATLCYPTNPLAITAAGLLPPMMSSWRDGLLYRLDRARSLLEQAPGPRPERLRLMVIFGPRPYLPQPRAVARYIAGQLAELGIAVEIEPARDSEDYFRRVASGDYDMALTGWIADTLDPVDYLEACLASDSIPTTDRPISIHANLSRWRNEAVDGLLKELRLDPSTALQHELLAAVADEVPLLPLVTGSVVYVHSFQVRNFEPDPLGIPDFSRLDLRRL